MGALQGKRETLEERPQRPSLESSPSRFIPLSLPSSPEVPSSHPQEVDRRH
uniref:Uncharacterized protein n=1 Tax=Rhizophora mucronata TaxID=61149 RepID=A0A2P2NGZ4_RHIMU